MQQIQAESGGFVERYAVWPEPSRTMADVNQDKHAELLMWFSAAAPTGWSDESKQERDDIAMRC